MSPAAIYDTACQRARVLEERLPILELRADEQAIALAPCPSMATNAFRPRRIVAAESAMPPRLRLPPPNDAVLQ